MIIAQQKKKDNIVEYLLYMWQVEDLIRANHFDLYNIQQTIVSQYEQPDNVKQQILQWYGELINMMRSEGVMESGHIQLNKNVMAALTEAGVRCRLYQFFRQRSKWYYAGGIETPMEENDEIVVDRFRKCDKTHCLTLDGGKLGYCSRAVISERVQGYASLPTDYVIVEDSLGFRAELSKYLGEKKFITACRYCYGTHGELIEPAVQISD